MFGLNFKSRKSPTQTIIGGVGGSEMMGFQRSFSTTTIGKSPSKSINNLNYHHLNYDLSKNINAQKRFSNPNFVNKHNPNVFKSLQKSQSAPMRISTFKTIPTMPIATLSSSSSSEQLPIEIEVGVDPLAAAVGVVSSSPSTTSISSPICIAVSTTPNNEITIAITPDSFGRTSRCKTRLNSDCASEESFIIFECGSDDNDESNDEIIDDTDENDDSDDDNEDEECSSSDDDDCDLEGDEESDIDEVDFVKKVPFKKVRFCDKPLIHPMIKWDYAYRAARKGPWEEHMRDRCRFENRIAKLEEVIGPILSASHRTKVFNDRFKSSLSSD